MGGILSQGFLTKNCNNEKSANTKTSVFQAE
jgi:hypothetical protein